MAFFSIPELGEVKTVLLALILFSIFYLLTIYNISEKQRYLYVIRSKQLKGINFIEWNTYIECCQFSMISTFYIFLFGFLLRPTTFIFFGFIYSSIFLTNSSAHSSHFEFSLLLVSDFLPWDFPELLVSISEIYGFRRSSCSIKLVDSTSLSLSLLQTWV